MASEKIILGHKKKRWGGGKWQDEYDNQEEIQFKNEQIVWIINTFWKEKLTLALVALACGPNYWKD